VVKYFLCHPARKWIRSILPCLGPLGACHGDSFNIQLQDKISIFNNNLGDLYLWHTSYFSMEVFQPNTPVWEILTCHAANDLKANALQLGVSGQSSTHSRNILRAKTDTSMHCRYVLHRMQLNLIIHNPKY